MEHHARHHHRLRIVTVEELTQRNVELISRLETAAADRLSAVDRVIDWITAFCGSTAFLVVHVLWFGAWLALNTVPGIRHFDPYPFQFLTLVVSLEAILLSTFILITQNRQAALADRRNHLDLQINLLSEQENTKMLLLLDRVARKLGVDECNDPEMRALEQQAHPERLVEQIEQTLEKHAPEGEPTAPEDPEKPAHRPR
jgi:uncharacterized membrane protein